MKKLIRLTMAAALLAQIASVQADTLMIKLGFEDSRYTILDTRIVEGDFAQVRAGDSRDDLVFDIRDVAGSLLQDGWVENPRMVRGPLDHPDIEHSGDEEVHRVIDLREGSFWIKVPYQDGMEKLTVRELSESALDSARGVRAAPSAAPAGQQMDLGSFLSQ